MAPSPAASCPTCARSSSRGTKTPTSRSRVSRPGYAYRLHEQVGYEEGWELQRRIADSVARGELPDTVLLLEHAPVVTLGRRTEDGELHIPDGAEVEIVETDRGGKSTYHGPGQLVCYPIFD